MRTSKFISNTCLTTSHEFIFTNFRDFFDVSDGIFTNYNWSILHLERTSQLIDSKMPNRRKDVFFGIDVFGRGQIAGFRSSEVKSKISETPIKCLISFTFRHSRKSRLLNSVQQFLLLVGPMKQSMPILDSMDFSRVPTNTAIVSIKNFLSGTIVSGVRCTNIFTCSDLKVFHSSRTFVSDPESETTEWAAR